MVKLTKIYTRTGDKGQTSLGDGARVAKSSARIEAMGAVDEANAALGLACCAADGAATGKILERLQNDLFDLGADLCLPLPDPEGRPALRITAAQGEWLEHDIDRMNGELAPLNSFILPGGSALAAHLHMARTLTRRAERAISRLAETETVNPALLVYINRLSDHLFVLSRYVNGKGARDVLWVPGASREDAGGKAG